MPCNKITYKENAELDFKSLNTATATASANTTAVVANTIMDL